MPSEDHLFAALRAAFPADLDATAIEAIGADGHSRYYTWRDLDQAGPSARGGHARDGEETIDEACCNRRL